MYSKNVNNYNDFEYENFDKKNIYASVCCAHERPLCGRV